MKQIEESSKTTLKWSLRSFWSNLAAAVVALLAVYINVWIFLLVDVLVLAGLAFFFKALYDCVRAKTWNAFIVFTPALVVQIVMLVVIGVAFWSFWTMPDSAHS